MTRYLLRLSSIIGLAFGLLIGVAVSVGYLLPESLESVHAIRLADNISVLYLYDVYRGVIAPLTHASGLSPFVEWSPDGTKIAYIAKEDEKSSIYVTDRFGKDKQQFALDHASIYGSLNWSPNSQYLFDGKYLINTITKQVEVLKYPFGKPFIWSSDSQTLQYIILNSLLSEDYLKHVYEISILCTETNPICKPRDLGIPFSPIPTYFGEIVWSPDKKAIAYSEYPSHQDLRIMVAYLDCEALVDRCIKNIYLAADTPLNDMRPIWSPNGTQLAFTTESYEIYIVTLSNFSLQSFTIPSGVNSVDNWSPDGRYISYYSDGKYYLLDVISGQPRPVFTNLITLLYPIWRPMPP